MFKYYFHYFIRAIVCYVMALIFIIAGSPNKENTKVVNHKGYSSKYVENSESAFLGAAKKGACGIETDIRITKDGVPVCCHDVVYEFTDGSVKSVYENTFAQLTECKLPKGDKEHDDYICSFERYLEICKEYNLVCFLDIKEDLNDEKTVKVFELAKKVYDLDMIIPQSSSMENLKLIRKHYPEIHLMYTLGRIQFEKGFDYHDCFEYNIGLDADITVITKKMIKDFREHDLPVATFTCNSIFEKNYAYYLHVDYMETDV